MEAEQINKLHNDIEIIFGFSEYLNQFRNEGIVFSLFKNTGEAPLPYKKEDGKTIWSFPPVEFLISFDNKVTWIAGKPEPTNSKDRPMTERFYQRLLQDSSCNEKRFIERNLKYLNSLPNEIKEDYEYIFYPLLELFEEAQKKGGLKRIAKIKSKPTYRQYALYYYYMQKAGLKDLFENWPGGIVAAYKEVCKTHNLTAKTGWRIFQSEYTGLTNESSRMKFGRRNYDKLMELLKDSPKAITEANQELNKTRR